jgi:hypothetical protein
MLTLLVVPTLYGIFEGREKSQEKAAERPIPEFEHA